ncbi:MAG: ATP-binding cassette domain-containing protein [Treponema sp.]|nr:ATP-binding cassette domain-containing protein [Treponema sp.]
MTPGGRFTLILGPSGCGKRTFLRLAAGLETADSGKIDLSSPVQRPSRSRFGLCFSTPGFCPGSR